MTNITETIARALCSSDERNPDDPFFANSPDGMKQWKGYEWVSLQLITALEAAGYAIVPTSPTPEMAKAGLHVSGTGAVLGAWDAMINTGKAKA